MCFTQVYLTLSFLNRLDDNKVVTTDQQYVTEAAKVYVECVKAYCIQHKTLAVH